MKSISVLCVNSKHTNYKLFPDLDLWDEKRDAYNFNSDNYIIAHPPCSQWSKLRGWAKEDKKEKDLAMFCLENIHKNGGILEHPALSSFFKYAGIKPTLSIDLSWFGFPARKPTWLYYFQVEPVIYPISFNAIDKRVEDLHSSKRAVTPKPMIEFLLKSFEKP